MSGEPGRGTTCRRSLLVRVSDGWSAAIPHLGECVWKGPSTTSGGLRDRLRLDELHPASGGDDARELEAGALEE